MNIPAICLVYLLLAALMATLTWVGWKFFYIPASPIPRPEAGTGRQEAPRAPRWRHRSWPAFHPRKTLAPLLDRRLLWLFVPVLVVGFTVAVILTFSKSFDLDPLSAEGLGPQAEVSARLGEERLVPPPDFPPSLFLGTERPDLGSADRDWKRMDRGFTQVVLRLFERMEQRGYPVALLEGYRSPERQEMLAAKGPSVTNARAFQSKHQYGLAADIAPIRQGRLVISERDPWAAEAYAALGEESRALGLIWGGGWAMRDLGHVESPAKLSTLTKANTPS